MTTHYETLGIPRDADEATIRKARRAKASTAHPDKGGSDEEMQKVNRAYGVLIDPAARKRYDETGEDGPAGAPSVTSVAEEAFAQLVRKVIETDDTNLVKAVERTVKGADADLKASEATARRAVLRLEKRRAKIKVKGDKPNIAHRIIDEQIRGHDQTIARVEFHPARAGRTAADGAGLRRRGRRGAARGGPVRAILQDVGRCHRHRQTAHVVHSLTSMRFRARESTAVGCCPVASKYQVQCSEGICFGPS